MFDKTKMQWWEQGLRSELFRALTLYRGKLASQEPLTTGDREALTALLSLCGEVFAVIESGDMIEY